MGTEFQAEAGKDAKAKPLFGGDLQIDPQWQLKPGTAAEVNAKVLKYDWPANERPINTNPIQDNALLSQKAWDDMRAKPMTTATPVDPMTQILGDRYRGNGTFSLAESPDKSQMFGLTYGKLKHGELPAGLAQGPTRFVDQQREKAVWLRYQLKF